jgi:hypothetical protein
MTICGISLALFAVILKRTKQRQEDMFFKKAQVYSIDAITVE